MLFETNGDFTGVIVTFNNEGTVGCLLRSIPSRCQLIIIDNFSGDKTCQIVKDNSTKIRLIKNKKNLGFAAAANQGARLAKSDYLLFLNPDTLVKPGAIEKTLNFAKAKKDATVVGCKVLSLDRSLQPSCGRFPTIFNIVLDRIPIINKFIQTEQIRQENYYSKIQNPDWVTGAFFLVKREVFEKLGGFDEKYFMYVEDVDFCYRAKKAGYKIYYNPRAEIIHYNQGKMRQKGRFKARHMRRGFTIFFEKYKPYWYLNIWKTILAIEKLLRPSLR